MCLGDAVGEGIAKGGLRRAKAPGSGSNRSCSTEGKILADVPEPRFGADEEKALASGKPGSG